MIQQPQQGQQFKGFKPSGMEKIANAMGFQGNIKDFQKFLQDNPDRQTEMMRYQDVAREMARGGIVKMQEGGTVDEGGDVPPTDDTTGVNPSAPITDVTAERMQAPKLPTGAKLDPELTRDETGAYIPTTTGELTGDRASETYFAQTEKADDITPTTVSTVAPDAVKPDVDQVVDSLDAAQANPDDPRLKIVAQEQTKSSVSDLNAAQGTGILIDNPVQREIKDGELISGVADAEKAKKFTEEIQAATATPSEKATVAGQMKTLTEGFDATNPPPWAAGALRGVMAQMQARGMGTSSIAGQAMVQAALESALPIASADANTQASFEAQNLSNRQARAMLAAEQRAKFLGMEFDQAFQAKVQNSARIGDIANMNFTAEQQVQLENSRIANTMELSNLNNKQAMLMAEAGALANLDMANLNNRQQTAVQNAQNFLQVDMANLSNQQQTDIFKTQQRVQALFTDQAAENAAKQFNASSQNQTDQFFANLANNVSQFNATQANAQNQYNAGQANTVARFNTEVANQRDQFNAANQTVIAQANAQWRRQIATADTAAINRANEINATNVLDMSKTAYDNLWQYYSDAMEFAWEAADNDLDRQTKIATARIQADANITSAELQRDAENSRAVGGFAFRILENFLGK
tara:strand:+ start:317 stop:2236 length:1920 start_codon:yes stop_codon:yes gene_type:complete